jgi:transposase InsO family protein
MRSRPQAFGGPGKPNSVRQPRLRKHFRDERRGHCVALESIELRAQNERRYIIITCTDLHSHFAWAWATRSHASAAAAQFFRLIQAVFPFAIEAVLTDNGPEFVSKAILEWLAEAKIDTALSTPANRGITVTKKATTASSAMNASTWSGSAIAPRRES